jgi:Aspartyl protease
MQSGLQPWLRTIVRSPELYEGRIVAIDNDTTIVAVADSFREAREAASAVRPEGRLTYFSVPFDVADMQIMTLRLQSLREDTWSPMYTVGLKSAHSELWDCRMLIDSGADISLISKKTGEELGLQRSDEEETLSAKGIGGTISYLRRKIIVVIDSHAVAASVAWCQNAEVADLILGRKDIFDAFNIEFRQHENRIIFTPVGDLRKIHT